MVILNKINIIDNMKNNKGFTFIELVMIFGALSLLAYSYVTYTANVSSASLDVAARIIQSDLRWAHQQSMATGVNYGGVFTSGVGYTIFEGAVGTPATNPVTAAPWVDDFSKYQNVVILNNLTVQFDRYGRPIQGGDGRVELQSEQGDRKDVYIVEESGLVIIDMQGAGAGCQCKLCFQ